MQAVALTGCTSQASKAGCSAWNDTAKAPVHMKRKNRYQDAATLTCKAAGNFVDAMHTVNTQSHKLCDTVHASHTSSLHTYSPSSSVMRRVFSLADSVRPSSTLRITDGWPSGYAATEMPKCAPCSLRMCRTKSSAHAKPPATTSHFSLPTGGSATHREAQNEAGTSKACRDACGWLASTQRENVGDAALLGAF